MCFNEIYCKVTIRKHFSDTFPTKNGQKERDNLSPSLFKLYLAYGARKGYANQEVLKLNETQQLQVKADVDVYEAKAYIR
jgi:hypothetical protein